MIKIIMNLRELNLKETKEDLINSFRKDTLIIHTIHTVDILNSSMNKLIANLRERYSYYNIKDSKIPDSELFLKEVEKFNEGALSVKLGKRDLKSMSELLNEINSLKNLKESQRRYMENMMKEVCPNLLETAGDIIGAKLIELGGSLKNLAEMPSSKIQVLGAEKALFRHLIKKAKAPKFGVIFNHESISKAENKGKAARQLASKISIAVKKDYFKNK